MKLSQVAKPSTGLILSPTLRRRTLYAALMMLGIGIMLFTVAGSVSKDQAAAVWGWAVGFLLVVVLLVVPGVAAVWGQLVGVAARDVKNELVDESNKNTPHTSSTSEPSNISETSNASNTSDDNELSDMERPLIQPPKLDLWIREQSCGLLTWRKKNSRTDLVYETPPQLRTVR